MWSTVGIEPLSRFVVHDYPANTAPRISTMHEHTRAQLAAASIPLDHQQHQDLDHIASNRLSQSTNKPSPTVFHADNMHIPQKLQRNSTDGENLSRKPQPQIIRGIFDVANGPEETMKHAIMRLRCDCEACDMCRKRRDVLSRNGMCFVEAIERRDTA
ncbi:uncharacterized protein K452DRAFT_343614 [Aplosporella prunicola CBS 121167]|uniref:Uncharacterized protein n=1 Tax=Aplosporella prunicola CBS 121167 TaxID=1176127 RepID=A0A6A6BLS0_9PEZI|nr:uncharacterized protein K452DRAFT_343614 [Aplosporella prunicola CBS 121167]KAF2145062.1 hypothetical protein K452DRAFT_343614 [Aplosporella prunicola CBS 121167]